MKGTIVSNDDKWIYDWFEIEAVCPRDVDRQLKEANGDEVIVEVNSGGGDVFAGNEIFYLLNSYLGPVTVDIVGFAGSAATIICCGAKKVRAIPSALYMIHNVSSGAQGDYHAMDHQSKVLQTANKSIANAYRLKTGLSEKELLSLMDKESWMDAIEAKEKGFIDEIIGDQGSLSTIPSKTLYNACFTNMLSQDVINKIRNTLKQPTENNESVIFMQSQLNLLKLKGEMLNEI